MERFCVGIPFFNKEDPLTLDLCLKNIERCLQELPQNPNTVIILAINGPGVKKQYSSDINFSSLRIERVVTFPPGITHAIIGLARVAIELGFDNLLLTDVDIYRFPLSIKHLVENWEEGMFVYGNYSAYPLEIMKATGIEFSREQEILYSIFQADKHPLIRPYVAEYRKRRFKSSFVLGSCNDFINSLSCQNVTSDSVMSHRISPERLLQIPNAAYFHYPRIDLVDYIHARLRHARAAVLEKRFTTTYYRQEVIYTERDIENIVTKIKEENCHNGEISFEYTTAISYFLLQVALRHAVYKIAEELYLKNNPKFIESFPTGKVSLEPPILSFSEAKEKINLLIGSIKDKINQDASITRGIGLTQQPWRNPIDCEKLFEDYPNLRSYAIAWLGLSENQLI